MTVPHTGLQFTLLASLPCFQITVIFRLSTPWALEIHGQKTGVGVYAEKPFARITHIHTDHRIIKKRGWVLTQKWALTQENTVHPVPAHALGTSSSTTLPPSLPPSTPTPARAAGPLGAHPPCTDMRQIWTLTRTDH